jgi:hypothetical protein
MIGERSYEAGILTQRVQPPAPPKRDVRYLYVLLDTQVVPADIVGYFHNRRQAREAKNSGGYSASYRVRRAKLTIF